VQPLRPLAPAAVPLRRNRDFNLLWVGQVVSDIGTRVSGIAFPLLVLATTGSPAKAGVVEFAASIPLLVLTLPAGALVDRWDRKRLLVVCDAVRGLAYASLAATFALGHVWFQLILAVALVTGSDFTANALYLVVIVLARERGASPALIGAMFAFLGVGGLVGSLVAPRLARLLSVRVVVVGTLWTATALVPLLFLPGTITP